MNTISKIILGVLVIAALFLGYKIYEKKSVTDSLTENIPSESTSTQNTTETPVVKKTLLTPPGEGSTEAQLRAWGELVSQSALPGTTLEIAGCVAVPEAMALEAGKDFTVTNADNIPHTLVLNPTTTFLIPANSSKTIKADFGKGPGIYAFSCDNRQEAVGVFLVK